MSRYAVWWGTLSSGLQVGVEELGALCVPMLEVEGTISRWERRV